MTDRTIRAEDLKLTTNSELLTEKRDFTSELLHSFAYSALQQPISGAAQLIDKVSGDAVKATSGSKGTNLLPSVQFMSAPERCEFGSSQWHAQQLGSAAGLGADIVAVSLLARKSFAGKSIAYSLPMVEQTKREVTRMTLTGAALGGIFTPVSSEEEFWSARARNASVQALTFGTLAASSLGLKTLGGSLERAGRSGGALLGNEVFANALAGIPAGTVHAQTESLLSGKGFASLKETGKSVYAFSTVGGTLGAVGGTAKFLEGLAEAKAEARVKAETNAIRETARGAGKERTPPPEWGERPGTESGVAIREPAEGGLRTVRADGTVVRDFGEAGSNGTRRIFTRTDQTKVYERTDGSIKTVLTDGTKITEYPLEKGGQVFKVIETPDGTKSTEFWNGDKVTRKGNGTVITESAAEGLKTIESTDGVLISESKAQTVIDVQKIDPIKGTFFREIRTTDNASGQTTTQHPSVSRCGEFEVVDGYLGRRKISHDASQKGNSIQRESIEFSLGPVKSRETASDGTFRIQYREGAIKSEGYDWYHGEKSRFLEVGENVNPSAIEAMRQKYPNDTLLVFRMESDIVQMQTYRPDGRVITLYHDRAWTHDGNAVSGDILYPDGTISRNYRLAQGRVGASTELSNGVKINELRSFVTIDGAPTFEVRLPDGTKIDLRGGRLDFTAEANGEAPTRARTLLEFGDGQRIGADGKVMQPYDVYETARGAATRSLYRDGVTVTTYKDGRTLEAKFDGLDIRLKDNGKLEFKQKDGTTHITELNRLIEYQNRTGESTVYEN